MNDQEALQTMQDGLIKQGCQSLNINGTCRFRGINGNKCALGMLIPDEDYFEDMEDYSASRITHYIPSMENLSLEMLSDAQNIHDIYHKSEGDWTAYINKQFNKLKLEYRTNPAHHANDHL